MSAVQAVVCCQALPAVASHEIDDSLIRRMLVTDYYDGAIGGFLQCPVCLSVYHFITLDWSDNHFVRVIALSLVPADSMAKLASFFGEVPGNAPLIPQRMRRPSEEELDHIEAFFAAITRDAQPPSIVVAWDVSSSKVLAARKVSNPSPVSFRDLLGCDEPNPGPRYDWFKDLGVTRGT